MLSLDKAITSRSATCDRPGERLVVPSLVFYEWLRGPRRAQELAAHEALSPSEFVLPFEWQESALSARLYRNLRRPRGREIDIAIATCAISRAADLWILNAADFKDIPGLRLATLP